MPITVDRRLLRGGRGRHTFTPQIETRPVITRVLSDIVLPTDSLSQTQTKWNPGHYRTYGQILRANNYDTYKSAMLAMIANTGTLPNVKGCQFFWQWSAMEGATKGDYAAGIARWEELADAAAAVGKRLMMTFNASQFGGYGGDWTVFYPDYLVNGPTYGITESNVVDQRGLNARLWQAATADAAADMHEAFAAALDSHPGIEAVSGAESSVNVTEGTDGYSFTNLMTYTKVLHERMRAAWKKTNLRYEANYLANSANMIEMIQHCYANDIGIGGPDIYPRRIFTSNQVFTGQIGGFDYRRKLPFYCEIQEPELGGYHGTYTNTELYNSGMNGYTYQSTTQQPVAGQYWLWGDQNYQGGAEQKWPAILAFINSISGAVGDGSISGGVAVRKVPALVAKPAGYM